MYALLPLNRLIHYYTHQQQQENMKNSQETLLSIPLGMLELLSLEVVPILDSNLVSFE